MKYFVVIERQQVIEVEASSEEQALNNIREQLLKQDPRDTAKLSIATEVQI